VCENTRKKLDMPPYGAVRHVISYGGALNVKSDHLRVLGS